ncbi:MAG: hypothetical protein COV01_03770 [Candidatus Taylorbacteria bacterium CG10_big_fil_rev_8_21_14_0_10_41_48]|uniref:Uncharacterized protein n=1 Tax=Candidatus Taylorbacteria bacterium CG10_big_fil_rev_8_21_14_0_10_41_48 TaxID=1975024 RepID=A0A2M8LBC1_9BACT|nr:MAG: hypothetical protein COV01_03770 [Candidatus Taylorbacteria bacterium CG10_big_fil_rev_8_21_14_0_10_41_48]
MATSEKVLIELNYEGRDVDNGSMSVEDMVPALQGFSSAYGKIAGLSDLEVRHSLRVTAVEKGSFHILLDVSTFIVQNKDQLEAIASVTTIASLGLSGAIGIVKAIMWTIQLTKHTEKKPYSETINANNQSIVVTNSKNVSVEVPIQIFQIFKSGSVSADLNKIVQPLETGKIDSTEIVAKTKQETIKEKILVDEKKFFDVEEIVITKTQEMWLTGMLNSLTKTTNRGFFLLNDGSRISYKLANDKPENLYPFFIHKGLVKVKCVAHMDENLKPAQIDIFDIEKAQQDFDFKTNG